MFFSNFRYGKKFVTSATYLERNARGRLPFVTRRDSRQLLFAFHTNEFARTCVQNKQTSGSQFF